MMTRNQSRPRRRHVLAALVAAPLMGAALHAQPAAAGNIWDGGGSNNNWTNDNNWNDDNPPANNGQIDVVMAGIVRTTPVVNVPYDIRGLIFNFNAAPFILSGQELTLRAGGIFQGDTNNQIINNAIEIEASQIWDAFSGPLTCNGTINLGGLTPHTLNITGPFATTIDARIEGFGTLIKSGEGTLTLDGSGSNTYVGATIVNGGALLLAQDPNGAYAIPTNLIIGDGVGTDVVRFLDNGQIADTAHVTINSSGLLDLQGWGSFPFAGITINGGSMNTPGGWHVSGSLSLNSGSYSPNGGFHRAGNIRVGVNGSAHFVQSARVDCVGDLRLGIGASASGRYDVNSGWLTVGGGVFVGGTGSGQFRINAATCSVSGLTRIDRGDLTQTGGVATFAGVLNSAAMHLSGGVTSVADLDGTGSLTVSGAGALTANRIRQGQLTITGANPRVVIRANGTTAATSRVAALNLGTPGLAAITGKLDLANNDLVIDYAAGTPLTTVRQYIASGHSGGAWTGAGINTSMGNSSTLGLGYAEASEIFTTFPATFSGQIVDDTTVLVGFTRYGDADLNGTVALSDFNRLAANFGSSAAFWSDGDFNYDGNVNLNDFNLLAGNFGLSAAGAAVTPTDWAALASAVPEPAGLSVLAAAGVMLTRQRRRRLARAAFVAAPLIGAALHARPARAGNIWDGGGSTDNWTNRNNWNDDDEPPANNGMIDVVMAGTTRLTPNVNVPYDIRGLIFNFDAGPFVVSGEELTIRAGGILQGDTGVQAINNAIDIEASQTWDAFSGPLVSSGTVNLGGLTPHTLNVSGPFSTTISGRIEGLGQLVMFGTLQLSLGGTTANTYVGATVVNSGLVTLNKPPSVTAISSNLTIGDGTGSDVVRLVANHQIADTSNVTINSSGLLDLNVRSETIANLTINGGSVATSGETFTVNSSLALASGTYTARGQTFNAGSMQVGVNGSGRFIQPAGFFSNVSCFGDLRVGNGASGSGQYDLHAGQLGVVGTTSIGGAGTGRYVQTGGLALVQYVVNDGSMQISGGQFTGNSLDGTGSLSVTGTGGLSVTRIRQGGGLTITGTNARVRIAINGTTLALSRVGALDLGTPGAGGITGKLDLTNNFLIVDYTTASPLPTVRQYIASGHNAGAWDGPGINTSRGTSSTFGIGYAEASDLFTTFPTTYVGHSIDGSTLLVAFTRYGDANLDRVVNLDDFNRLAANFGASGGAVWSMGDFNYDGVVNLDDFNKLAGNFGLSAAGPTVTTEDWAALASAVPEPAGLAFGVIGAAAGCARRAQARRRRPSERVANP